MRLKRFLRIACAFTFIISMLGIPAVTGADLPDNSVTASAAGELSETDIKVDIYTIDYRSNRTLLASMQVREKVTKKKIRYVFETEKFKIDSAKIKDIEYVYSVPSLPADRQVRFNGYLSYHLFNADYDAAGAGIGKDDQQSVSPEKQTSVYTWKDLFANDPHRYTLMTLGGQILNFSATEYTPPTTPLNDAAVTVKDAVCTGKAATPAVSVNLNGRTLSKGSDYTVSYINNVSVGKATVIIQGINGYSGIKSTSFLILPAKITAGKLTSPKTKTVKLTWKKTFGGVEGYKVQIALDKSFKKSVKTVTVKGEGRSSQTIKGLKKGKKYYARVCAFKKISGKEYSGKWSKTLKVKCK